MPVRFSRVDKFLHKMAANWLDNSSTTIIIIFNQYDLRVDGDTLIIPLIVESTRKNSTKNVGSQIRDRGLCRPQLMFSSSPVNCPIKYNSNNNPIFFMNKHDILNFCGVIELLSYKNEPLIIYV